MATGNTDNSSNANANIPVEEEENDSGDEQNENPPRQKTNEELLNANPANLTPTELIHRELLIIAATGEYDVGDDSDERGESPIAGWVIQSDVEDRPFLPVPTSACYNLDMDEATKERMFKQFMSQAKDPEEAEALSKVCSWGIPCELISPHRCLELSPMLNVEDIVGGLWIPGDGVGDPHLFGMSLMREAVEQGVGVMEDCAVTAVRSRDEKVCGVETTRGAIECQYFVNCAGFWARQVGQLSSPQVKVPLLPCEHYYLHTKTIEGLDPMTPVIRDPDGYIYQRKREGCILAGGYEPVAQSCVAEDWDHFHVLLQQLLQRVPTLSQAVLHNLCNDLEAFSQMNCRQNARDTL